MAGVYHLNIHESEAELKKLLRKEKTGSLKKESNCFIFAL